MSGQLESSHIMACLNFLDVKNLRQFKIDYTGHVQRGSARQIVHELDQLCQSILDRSKIEISHSIKTRLCFSVTEPSLENHEVWKKFNDCLQELTIAYGDPRHLQYPRQPHQVSHYFPISMRAIVGYVVRQFSHPPPLGLTCTIKYALFLLCVNVYLLWDGSCLRVIEYLTFQSNQE